MATITIGRKSGMPVLWGKTGLCWACKSCGNENFADRENCNKCSDPRTLSQWHCSSCNNWNWLDRSFCNMCKQARNANVEGEPEKKKPRHAIAAPEVPSAEMIDDDTTNLLQLIQTLDPEFTGEKHFRDEKGYDLVGLFKELDTRLAPIRARHCKPHEVAPIRARPPVSRPTIPVYPIRTIAPSYSYPSYPSAPIKPLAAPTSGVMSWIQERPGSWECFSCSNWNFADRTSCNRCGHELKPAKMRYVDPTGKWLCSGCGPTQWNFADRANCNKCKRPRSEVEMV